jgi:1-acyl-sn-glycerol-3-phosphate acyltransferase
LTALPRLAPAIPRRGSALMRCVGRTVLALMRFRVEGDMPDLPKFVVIVAPHTSNWDFVVGAAAMFALDLRLSFIGKDTLFRMPFGTILRWMGGIPVDRSSAHGVVGEAIAAFARVDRRILAIAPEGTRRKVPQFRSGFLHIACGAGVPVVYAALDWGARVVRLGPTVDAGPDLDAARQRAEEYFARIRGRNR